MDAKNKIIFILILLFQYPLLSVSQNNYEVQIPAAPSPKLAELSKYADFETITQNGVVPVSVPLFTIKTGNYSHPISLSYHTGGIKVNQDATWVGLGWSMVMGGSITRSVRDIPDDVKLEYMIQYEEDPDYFGTHITEWGWLKDPQRIKNFPEITNDDFKLATDRTWGESDEVDAAIALRTLQGDRPHFLFDYYIPAVNDFPRRKYDLEPDIFYLNIGEISLKFIFGSDGLPKILNSPNYFQITAVKGGPDNINLVEFIVKDLKGNIYFFGQNNKIETSTVATKFYSTSSWITGPKYFPQGFVREKTQAPLSKTFTTGWFLTKIETVQGREINFQYFSPSEPLQTDFEIGQFRTKQISNNAPHISTNGNQWNKTKNIEHSIMTHYLNKIIFPSGIVDIELEPRTDLNGGYKIASISLNNNNGDRINAIRLNTSYRENRLFLDGLNNNDQTFTFSYNDQPLPDKNSVNQDFWGYACNKSLDLIPKIYVYPNDLIDYYRVHRLPPERFSGPEIILPGSDRSVDLNSIKARVLEEIIYPTGGKVIYTYEPNEYYDEISQTNIAGGGLRISSITKTKSNGEPLLEKVYKYINDDGSSSGILINKLSFATPTSFEWISDLQIRYYHLVGTLSDFEKWDSFTIRGSNNYFPLTNLEGNQISYTRVEEITANNGRKVSYYYKPQNYKDNSTMVNTASMIGFKSFVNVSTTPFVEVEGPAQQLFLRTDCEGDPVIVNNSFTVTAQGHGLYHAKGHNPDDFLTESFYKLEFNGTEMVCSSPFFISGVKYVDDPMTQHEIYALHQWPNDYFSEYNDIVWGEVMQSGNSIFPFLPLSDDDKLYYGKLWKEEVFIEGDVHPIKITTYEYELQHWNNLEESVVGIVAQEHNVYSEFLLKQYIDACGTSLHTKRNFLSLTYDMYSMPKAWGKYKFLVNAYAFPKRIITEERVSDILVTSKKEYDYNSNFLLRKEINSTSEPTKRIVDYYSYALDYTDETGFINLFKENNLLSFPIEKVKYSIDLSGDIQEIIAGQVITYKEGRLGLIDQVFKLESDVPIKISNFKFSNQISGVSPADVAENNFSYDKRYYKLNTSFVNYDLFGNPIRIITHEGTITDFEWSSDYNYEYLTAKIVNPGLNEERTIYEYKPLYGPTSITDSNNIITHYHYDNFGRLKLIKDHEDNIIKRYSYQYKVE